MLQNAVECSVSQQVLIPILFLPQTLIKICIDYCLILEATDLLFSDIYERFVDLVVGRSCFLECLEPYIIGDHLTSLSPVVLKDFIEHYQTQQMLQRVENCLLHLEVQNLDLHQVSMHALAVVH